MKLLIGTMLLFSSQGFADEFFLKGKGEHKTYFFKRGSGSATYARVDLSRDEYLVTSSTYPAACHRSSGACRDLSDAVINQGSYDVAFALRKLEESMLTLSAKSSEVQDQYKSLISKLQTATDLDHKLKEILRMDLHDIQLKLFPKEDRRRVAEKEIEKNLSYRSLFGNNIL